jgi:hypothetical protein
MVKINNERVVNLGEVKTPKNTVDDILDLFEDINYKSRYFEPGCGDGNFLTEILSRKLEMISNHQDFKDNIKQNYIEIPELKIIIAVASIYGVDIDKENIINSQQRIKNIVLNFYKKKFKTNVIPEYFEKIITKIISSNIVVGDLLNGIGKIEVIEYSEVPINRVQKRLFKFEDLLYPDDEIFRDDLKLFGHIPEPYKTHKPLHYREL